MKIIMTARLPDDLKTSVFKIVLANSNGNMQYQALRRYAAELYEGGD